MYKPVGIFDSGLGSYAIVEKVHQRFPEQDIIYFADRGSFPYGAKTVEELKAIINRSVDFLKDRGCEYIILASNSPSITVLSDVKSSVPIIGIYPPVAEVVEDHRKSTLVLGAKVMTQSAQLRDYIKAEVGEKYEQFHAVNGSDLIKLIENGDFLFEKEKTLETIKVFLEGVEQEIVAFDSITLSSTHFPWLSEYFKELRPDVRLYDPADKLIEAIEPMTTQGSGEIKAIISQSKEYPAEELIAMFEKLDIHLDTEIVSV